ncbi:MAG: hypothetical protein P8129_05470 [Anaerolineae bacterium]
MKHLTMMTLLLALLLVAPGGARAQDSGVLEGTVVNGTQDGPEIGAGLAVTLHVIQDTAEVQTLETETGAGGSFRFEGLNTDPALEYWLEAVYLDVATSSPDPYQFEEGQTQIDATLTVYETTSDDSAIRAGSVHIIAESFGEVLRLSEIHFYGNTGDRAYVGTPGEDGRPRTVFIPLPQGATGVALDEGIPTDRFIEVDGGLWDTDPVPPGGETTLVFFSYHLLVGGDTVPVEREFAYPVDSLNILLAQPGLTLRSDQLQSRGMQSFEDRTYEMYALGSGLGAGESLSIDLVPMDTGETAAGTMTGGETEVTGVAAEGNQGLLRTIGFALAFLAVGAVVAYSLGTRGHHPRRRRGPDRAPDAGTRRLLVELADLEEAHEAGQVTEADYLRRRTEIYEALQSL